MNSEHDGLELIRRYVDGTATAEDRHTLQEALRADAALRRQFARYASLDAALGSGRLAAAPVIRVEAPVRRDSWSRLLSWRPLAAAAAAVVMIGAVMWWRHLGTGVPGVGETQMATLVFAEDCEWQRGVDVAEGERLAPRRLALVRGLAIVRFDGGAEIVMRGGTELELQSATQAKLRRGDVTVRAPDEAAGFKMLTPASELTDLGTEFAVKVERSGATELHVLEGEVAYAPDAKAEGTVLNAGKALRFERANDAPHSVTLDALRFDELVKKAAPRERPDLMTVYEGFLHAEGSYAPAEISGGKGWAGPWRLRERGEWQGPNRADTTTDMRIVHGKLNVPWPVEGGRRGMLAMPPGQFYRVRQMAKPITMDRDGITYFSLMTQEPNHSARGLAARTQEGVRLTFRSSANYGGECLSFGIGRELRPHVNALPSGVFESVAVVPDEQSLLWIGKIIRRADGEDEITFRIYGQNDPLDYAEPPTWHVATRGVRQSAALDLVVLSSTGNAPRIVDELRIGPTWRSVVPIKKTRIADAR